MKDEPRARVALTTCADADTAGKLARELVGRRLAACVNVVPRVRSIYRWQEEVCDDAECLLVIKTSLARMPALKQAVSRLHDYDVPELIVLDVVDGSEDYLAWVSGQVAGI